MLYELLTRRRLYKYKSDLETMQCITTEEPVQPSSRNPEVDPILGAIALRALRKDPDERFQTAAELGDALSAWLGRRGVSDIRSALSFWVRTHGGPIWPTPEERAQRWQQPTDTPLPGGTERSNSHIPIHRAAIDTPATSFIGRRSLLADLQLRLEQGDRWISLTGPAGVGKSRVALQLLHDNIEQWRPDGGAWRVDLTGVTSLPAACVAVARHLNIPLVGVDADKVAGRIGSALAARGPMLLVLDPADGVAAKLGQLVRTWLRRASDLQLVVVSRERMGAPEEDVIDVPPLSLPKGERLGGSEAVLLFAARAATARPGFRVADSEPGVIADLVRQLDGLPLALEFAAARIAVLEPADLLARLDHRFDVLGGPGERSSLRDALDESWDGLSDAAKTAMSACTVFEGGFDVAAAEAVVGRGALGVLDDLRDRSLLRAVPQRAGGAARFELLNSIRAFAVDRTPAGALQAAQASHAAYYGLHAQTWLLERHHHGGDLAARKLRLDRANLEVALRHLAEASSGEAGEQALSLAEALLTSGQGATDIDSRSQTLMLATNAGASGVRLERLTARMLLDARRHGEARRAVERGLSSPGVDDGERAECLLLLSHVSRAQGALAEAETCAQQAQALAERANLPGQIGRALSAQGQVQSERGDHPAAVDLFDRGSDLLRADGDLPREAVTRMFMAKSLLSLGELTKAESAIVSALVSSQQRGALRQESMLLWLQGCLQLERGELDRASATLKAADQGARACGALALLVHIKLADAMRCLLAGDPDRAQARLQELAVDERAASSVDKRQHLRAQLLTAHACAQQGDLSAAEAACRSAQSWLAGDTDKGRWDELSLAIAALERAQVRAGADAQIADRAAQRVLGAGRQSQWLRLAHQLVSDDSPLGESAKDD
ncbi:MAG: hypothetical protein KC502_16145, partial [Myxococcales bacterium]|nr:hypothetical protein [Myxococcales bacterium]